MDATILSYRIFPLGDAALTIDFGNCIDEAIHLEVMARFQQLEQERIPEIREIVPAYSSLTLYYSVEEVHKKTAAGSTAFDWVRRWVEQKMQVKLFRKEKQEVIFKVPVCYAAQYAPDLPELADRLQLAPGDIIRLHSSGCYKVYMLGFLPGFAYMGPVDDRIAAPRKDKPVPVVAGSVGIAGKQTGIYPLASPGGWQIIGRTPLKMFEPEKDQPALLKAGDIIQFYSITADEFKNY